MSKKIWNQKIIAEPQPNNFLCNKTNIKKIVTGSTKIKLCISEHVYRRYFRNKTFIGFERSIKIILNPRKKTFKNPKCILINAAKTRQYNRRQYFFTEALAIMRAFFLNEKYDHIYFEMNDRFFCITIEQTCIRIEDATYWDDSA